MKNEIDTTVEHWFEEATSYIQEKAVGDRPSDELCASVIPITYNYCTAALMLLESGRRLPVMALLRVLAELVLRTTWCLYSDTPDREITDHRAERWAKESLLQRKKLLTRIVGCSKVPQEDRRSFAKEIEDVDKMISGRVCEPAGNLFNSLDELPVGYREDMYPLLYSTFNRAVHPDPLLFADTVRCKGSARTYLGDLDHVDVKTLKIYCMTAAFNIVSVCRRYYGGDCKGITKEYMRIKQRFAAGP